MYFSIYFEGVTTASIAFAINACDFQYDFDILGNFFSRECRVFIGVAFLFRILLIIKAI